MKRHASLEAISGMEPGCVGPMLRWSDGWFVMYVTSSSHQPSSASPSFHATPASHPHRSFARTAQRSPSAGRNNIVRKRGPRRRALRAGAMMSRIIAAHAIVWTDGVCRSSATRREGVAVLAGISPIRAAASHASAALTSGDGSPRTSRSSPVSWIPPRRPEETPTARSNVVTGNSPGKITPKLILPGTFPSYNN